MKTTFQRIITTDNVELVGFLYEPDNISDTVLLHVHGMAGNFYENLFIDFLANTLTSAGIAFCVFNNRGSEIMKDLTKIQNGQRTFVRIGNAYEKFEDSVLDIRAMIDFVAERRYTKIHLSGHSLGSSKVAHYIVEGNDSRITSLLFLSPADMVGLAKADKNYNMDIQTASSMIAEGNGDELMPFVVWEDNYLTAKTYMSIGHESSKVAIFNLYNKEDALVVLSKIHLPTFTVMGRKDGALTVPVDELMTRVKTALSTSPKAETWILGDANHGYQGYEQALADVIKAWIESTSPVPAVPITIRN